MILCLLYESCIVVFENCILFFVGCWLCEFDRHSVPMFMVKCIEHSDIKHIVLYRYIQLFDLMIMHPYNNNNKHISIAP